VNIVGDLFTRRLLDIVAKYGYIEISVAFIIAPYHHARTFHFLGLLFFQTRQAHFDLQFGKRGNIFFNGTISPGTTDILRRSGEIISIGYHRKRKLLLQTRMLSSI
jgi:hypothetical protein